MRSALVALTVELATPCSVCGTAGAQSSTTEPRHLRPSAERPLYAIADASGGEWPELARKAQTAIRAASDDDADSMGEQLLRDMRDVFGEWAAERTKTGASPDEAS